MMKGIIYRFLLSILVKYVFFYTITLYSAKVAPRWTSKSIFEIIEGLFVSLAFLLPLPVIEVLIFIVPYCYLIHKIKTSGNVLFYVGLLLLQPLNIAYIIFMTSNNDRGMLMLYFVLNVLTLIAFFGKILFRIKGPE